MREQFGMLKNTHQHLTNRYGWYDRWHRWRYHHHVHWGILAMCILSISALAFSVLIPLTPIAHALSSGPNPTGTVTDAGAGSPSGSTITWTNPANAKTSNDIYATASLTTSLSSSSYLKATNFGFTIPSGSVIQGITVGIERKASGNKLQDKYVQIIKSDGSIGATNKAVAVDWGAETTVSYGGTADLWGETWTYSDINNTNFGVALSVYESGSSAPRTASVDAFTITVTYSSNTAPNAPTLVSPADGLRTKDTTPTLSVNYSDPDAGDTGTTNYRIATSAPNCLAGTVVASGTSAETASNNQNTTWTPGSSIGSDATYYWCAQNNDGALTSSWTSVGNFVLDTAAPTFTMQYYSDSGLTTTIADNSKLKAGTYYVKITSNETLSGTPTVSIAAEGTANDITNSATTLVSGNDYKYTRTIASDAAAIGSVIEDWSVTGTDIATNTATNINPTNEATKAMYTDTVAPTNQDTVFTPSTIKQGGATVTVVSSGDATNAIWFAPSGTISFVAGPTMTTAGGTATSILAPATAGAYRMFVIDAAGNVSTQSTAILTVDNTPPTFTMQYYSDSGLTTTITDNSKLKAGTYYVKISANESLGSTPTVSIAAEGTANDVTNGATTLVSGNDYKYTRTIASDAAAIGSVIEDWSVTGTDIATNTATNINPTNEATKAMYTDTTAPIISATAPTTLSYIKSITTSSSVSYTLSEAIASGTIIISRTSGSPDGSSPHTCTLKGTALNSGTHTALDLSNTTNSCVSAQSLVDGTIYTFAFNATDLASNPATPVSNASVTFDTSVPISTITSPADNSYSNSTTVALAGTSADTNLSATTISVDGGGYVVTGGTAAAWTYSAIGLSQGTHTFQSKGTDLAGNTGLSSVVHVTVDTIVPNAATGLSWSEISPYNFTSVTASWTKSNSADLANQKIQFYSDASCTVTSGGLIDLASNSVQTRIFTGADGITYTYKITSIDNATNQTVSGCSSSMLIDTTTPIITINNPTTAPAQSKTITVSANEGTLTQSITTGSVCDGTLTFAAYSSTTFTSETDNGKKVCYKAVDAATNTTYSMSNAIAGIDTSNPTSTITSPADNSYSNSTTVALAGTSADTNLSATTVSVDGGAFVATGGTAAAWTYSATGLSQGAHTFQSKGTDLAGNTGLSTIIHMTVDTSNPTSTITSPADNSYSTSVTVALAGTSADTNLFSTTISVDGGGFVATGGTASAWTYSASGLSQGVHTFQAKATDLASNTGLSSIIHVTVDTINPVISSTAPASSTHIKSITTSSAVSYTLSKTVASGTIIMFRTSGSPDSSSPHTCTLKGTALNTGAHTGFNMSDTTNSCTIAQSLVDGTIYTFAFNATDVAGNPATPVSNTSIMFDTTGPGLTINQAGGQADPTNNPVINFTVVFSEAINPASFTSADITTGGTATGVTWSAPTTADNITWTITTSAITTDGTVIPSIDAVKVTDTAGNDNMASTSTDNSVMYDTTGPVLAFSDNVAAGPVISDTVTATWGNASVKKWDYDADGICSTTAGDYAKTDVNSMNQITETNNTKYICLYAEDALGNKSTLAGANQINIDTTAPTGSITLGGGAIYWRTNTAPAISLTTDDAAQYQLCLNSATLGNSCTSVARPWTVYTATPAADDFGSDGAKTLYVQFKDTAGNISATYSDSITIDTTGPGLTINQAAGQADPTNNPAVNFTVVFSEAINPATFTADDITTGGTASGMTWSAPTTSDNITWTIATTSITGDGSVIPSINAVKVTDPAGNDNMASISTDNIVVYDTTAPAITITAPTKSSSSTITETTVHAADNFALTVANVTVDTSTTADYANFNCVQTNSATVDCTIDIVSSGDLVIKAVDNLTNSATQAENNYVITATAPAVSGIVSAPAAAATTPVGATTAPAKTPVVAKSAPAAEKPALFDVVSEPVQSQTGRSIALYVVISVIAVTSLISSTALVVRRIRARAAERKIEAEMLAARTKKIEKKPEAVDNEKDNQNEIIK